MASVMETNRALTHQSYAAFSAMLHERAVQTRIPLNGALEVTWRCNLSCIHCANKGPARNKCVAEQELTSRECSNLLDQIADAGCLWLLITGGEPLIREDFVEIYLAAKRRGFLVTLFTNGTAITPRLADVLAEWPPFQVEITLYGRSETTYERVTRARGAYKKCLGGIELLRERGIPLGLKTVALTANKAEITQIQNFAQELCLPFRFDAVITPRLDSCLVPLSARLTPEEIVELDLQDSKRVAEWHRLCERFCGPTEHSDSHELYQCEAGITGFSIDPMGGLRLCSLCEHDSYDLRQGTFCEGWEALAGFRRKLSTRETKCTRCQIKVMCGMCPANAELEADDPEEPVNFFCRTAHLRALKLGVPVPPHGECEHCISQPPGGSRPKPDIDLRSSLRRSGSSATMTSETMPNGEHSTDKQRAEQT